MSWLSSQRITTATVAVAVTHAPNTQCTHILRRYLELRKLIYFDDFSGSPCSRKYCRSLDYLGYPLLQIPLSHYIYYHTIIVRCAYLWSDSLLSNISADRGQGVGERRGRLTHSNVPFWDAMFKETLLYFVDFFFLIRTETLPSIVINPRVA
jgi:hypothetical protein